jgi:UTP--glucose-1-phosphate uridylyltransferase
MKLMGADAGLEPLLSRFGFDRALFERLRIEVAVGRLSLAANHVRGALERLSVGDVLRVPSSGGRDRREAYEAGIAAIRGGSVAVAVLNGGMATRFGGRPKGLVEAINGRSFLDLKISDVRHAERVFGGELPLVVMNSFVTDRPTRRVVADIGGCVFLFAQPVFLRLNTDGSFFRDERGRLSPYSRGHGDFVDAIRSTGVLRALHERGVRYLLLSNVDNVAARIDPVVLGVHVLRKAALTAELVHRARGDVGGAAAWLDGRPQIVEALRLPPEFNQDALGYFATNTFIVNLEIFDWSYPLTWLYVGKEVEGRNAVQLERLVNELTAFVPTTFVEVPRTGPGCRFVPVKTPGDLVAARPTLRRLLAPLLEQSVRIGSKSPPSATSSDAAVVT